MKRLISLILVICICSFLMGSLVTFGSGPDGHAIMSLNVCTDPVEAAGALGPALLVPAYELSNYSYPVETLPSCEGQTYTPPLRSGIERPPRMLFL